MTGRYDNADARVRHDERMGGGYDRRPPASAASKAALVLFAALAALGALGAVAVVGGYLALARDLTDPTELETIRFQEESIVYDRTGTKELARFGEFRRDVATWDELNDAAVLVDATTAVEDKTFWSNAGFDPAAIIASGIDALRGNARGASTITQQLVRQRLLEPDLVQDPGRTVERKLKEIIQSIRLTETYPGEPGKEAIIAAYLNQNFYGNDSYGVKAAARTYFGKAIADLTLAEAAILAALPQSPSEYDLVRNAIEVCDTTVAEDAECPKSHLEVSPDAPIIARRNQVLELMSQGRTPLTGDEFGPDDFEQAMDEPVLLAPQVTPRWVAPHFVWALRDELAARVCGPDAATCDQLEEGGFRITSSLDARLQGIAEKWVKAAAVVPRSPNPRQAARSLGLELQPWMTNLRDKQIRNGALVALDYQTGEIVAYVGSADYYATKSNRRFQPQFDVVSQGWRQPGSAFKPFIYSTGISDGTFSAGTMFMDVSTDFGGGYSPTDADNLERGPVRVTDALRFSLNIPAVKAGASVGTDHLFAKAQEFGLRFRTRVADAGLAIALGVEEVRPVDLATGYGTIANGGRYIGHTTILRIADAAGTDVVPAYRPPEGKQAISPQGAAIVTNILAGNTNPDINPFWGEFEVRARGGDRRPATLKTGTNNDARDLNAYGFIAPPTDEGRQAGEYALVAGAWNGNSDNSVVSTPNNPVFSIDVTTFVWQGFMTEATRTWGINDFAMPGGIERVEVDALTGLLPGRRLRTVEELFLTDKQPTERVGAGGGQCGDAVLLSQMSLEGAHADWLEADRAWIRRARRGPGTAGGPDRTRTSYFYNGGYAPYGRTWGALLGSGSCATPSPSASCVPPPTPDASGVVPSFSLPPPSGSEPPLVPCPTVPPSPSESPSGGPTPTPTEPPTPTPEPTATEAPTPTPTEPPAGGGATPTP
ncbi:MAG TPA: transglycosylase domain-containing protein [Candidatus Limnocylindrales bacterium]